MEQYLDLVDMKVKTMDNQLVINKSADIKCDITQSIFDLGVISDKAVKELINTIDKNNIYNFIITNGTCFDCII